MDLDLHTAGFVVGMGTTAVGSLLGAIGGTVKILNTLRAVEDKLGTRLVAVEKAVACQCIEAVSAQTDLRRDVVEVRENVVELREVAQDSRRRLDKLVSRLAVRED